MSVGNVKGYIVCLDETRNGHDKTSVCDDLRWQRGNDLNQKETKRFHIYFETACMGLATCVIRCSLHDVHPLCCTQKRTVDLSKITPLIISSEAVRYGEVIILLLLDFWLPKTKTSR